MLLLSAVGFALSLDGSAVITPNNPEQFHCHDLLDLGGDSFLPSVALMRGFVLGANAADPLLVENDGWSIFAAKLFAVCTEEPDLPLTKAVHRVFYDVMK